MDFKVGTQVDVIAGEYADRRGVIVEVYQRGGSSTRSYGVRITDGSVEAKGSLVAEQDQLRIVPLDCPFCGSPGYAREHEEMKGSFMAGCSDVDCIAHLVAFDFVSPETAIAAWNTRTGAAEARSFAERLERQAGNVERDGWVTAARLMREAAYALRGGPA